MWSHLFYSIVHFFLTHSSLPCFPWHVSLNGVTFQSLLLTDSGSCKVVGCKCLCKCPTDLEFPAPSPALNSPSLIFLFFTPFQLFPFIPICMSPFYVSLDIRIEVKSRKVHWHRNSEMGELSLTVIGTQGKKEQKGSFHPVNCVIITAPWAGLHSGFLYCIVVRSFEIF